MSTYLFDQNIWKSKLAKFFVNEKASLNSFGSKVNQTFEAATFATVIKYYKNNGWKITIINPKINGKSTFRLKFSTRGAPKNFSYAEAKKWKSRIEIRHQLRVKTKYQPIGGIKSSNLCCDIAIIKPVIDISNYSTTMAIENSNLIAFGEAKHMSAYPELLASFIGLVHEMQPHRLLTTGKRPVNRMKHLPPFLNISGYLIGTSEALLGTFKDRTFDIDIYHSGNDLKLV